MIGCWSRSARSMLRADEPTVLLGFMDQLRRRGWCVGRKRVARLMAGDGLVGAHARKKCRLRKDLATLADTATRIDPTECPPESVCRILTG